MITRVQKKELELYAKTGLSKTEFRAVVTRLLSISQYKYYVLLKSNNQLKALQLKAVLNYKLNKIK